MVRRWELGRPRQRAARPRPGAAAGNSSWGRGVWLIGYSTRADRNGGGTPKAWPPRPSASRSPSTRPIGRFLVAAAWLHDIGYSPIIATTGCHQVDGARYLADQGWNERLVALVAHHSGARFLPGPPGFADLMSRFLFEDTPVADALTYADQTVGPDGRSMSVPDRVAEAIARHGPGSPIARAGVVRIRYLLAAAGRVEDRLTRTPP